MRRAFLRVGIAAAAACGIFFATRAAHAVDLFKFGVGVMGAAGGNWTSKPGDASFTLGNTTAIDASYPGFAGFTAGAGLYMDARLLGVVGLEVDVYYGPNKGSGDIGPVNVTVGQTAIHLPVLLKATIPLPVLRPFAILGPEFVLPGKTDVTVTPANTLATTTTGTADAYMMLTGGLGLEIKVPIPAIDIRFPISLRFSKNLDMDDSLKTRERVIRLDASGRGIQEVNYNTQWEYQAQITAGAAFHF